MTAVIAKKTVHALRQRLNMVDAGTSGLQYKILRTLDSRGQTIA